MTAKWLKIISLFVFGSGIFLMMGCTARSEVAAAEVQREMPQDMDQDLFEQQVDANNDFAFDLYQSLRLEEGNLFYSPYSISIAAAMVYAGARGETEKQMSATLHYTLPQEQLHPVFNMLDQKLNTSQGDDADFQLNAVNSLWGQEQFPFLPDFLTLIARHYGAGVRLVDFTTKANREAARRTINDWVSQQTNEKIQELLPQEMLNKMTRLILVNAIYFKGEWQAPFENGTFDAPFFLLNDQQTNVPTMSRRAYAPYYQGQDCQAVRLPYKGARAEMIVLMPDAGKFAAFEQMLDQQMFDRILAGFENQEVKLYMPKFHFEYSKDMKDPLVEMGMPAAFGPEQADFSAIYDQTVEPNNLFIAHIAHKAFVAVDEKGTEAAAATGVVAEKASMPVVLRIDHPFIFILRDLQTGSILFAGRVLDPSAP